MGDREKICGITTKYICSSIEIMRTGKEDNSNFSVLIRLLEIVILF